MPRASQMPGENPKGANLARAGVYSGTLRIVRRVPKKCLYRRVGTLRAQNAVKSGFLLVDTLIHFEGCQIDLAPFGKAYIVLGRTHPQPPCSPSFADCTPSAFFARSIVL